MSFKKKSGGRPFSKDSRRDAKSGSFSRDRPAFGNRPFERSGRSSVEMFDAVCESCGKECQLPFRPTGGKPVYCRNCFNNQGGSKDAPRRSEPSGDLQEINRKLDKIMRALKID